MRTRNGPPALQVVIRPVLTVHNCSFSTHTKKNQRTSIAKLITVFKFCEQKKQATICKTVYSSLRTVGSLGLKKKNQNQWFFFILRIFFGGASETQN